MLKFLRQKRVQKQIYIVLAVGIIPPFLFWGVSFWDKGNKNTSSLALLENQKISATDYLASYKAVQHQISFMFGERSKDVLKSVNLKGEAWDRLLLLHKAQKEKIRVSDDEVVDWIARQPAFSPKGTFDKGLYELFIERALRTNPRAFEEEIRGMLAISKLQEKVLAKISLSDETLKKLYDEENAERDIAYAVIPWENFKDKVQVTDKDVEQILPMVKGQLTAPDKKTPLSDEEARAEVKKLVLQNKAGQAAADRLKEIKKKISGEAGAAGLSFEKALGAEQLEIKKLEKLKQGANIPGLGSPQPAQQALSKIHEGEITNPFLCDQGAAIVKLLKNWPADEKKFNEEKETFRKKKINEKISEGMQAMLNEERNKLKIDLEIMKKIFSEE